MSREPAGAARRSQGWSGWQEAPPPGGPSGPPSIRRVVITVIASLAIAIMAFASLADIIRRPDQALVKSDFAAFYCGAVVTRARGDPYALSRLRDCEATQVDRPGNADPARVGIDPDPLPGYDMAFFAPFTVLPYRVAALLWDALIVAAIGCTVALVSALTGLPWLAIAAIVAYSDGVLSIPYGQLPPVVSFGLMLAAYGLTRDRDGLTLIGAAIAMLEPHLGVPVALALVVWRPALRWRLIALGAALAVITLAAAGLPVTLEYIRVALPAQAQAEATTAIQYSLAWLLHYAGLPESSAIALASVQYLVTALVSVGLAGLVAQRLHTPAAIVLFPPAMVLIGGPYIHLQQIATALPFALVAATRLRGRAAGVTWVAIGLLAVPWPLQTRLLAIGATPIVLTVAFAALRRRRFAVALAGAGLAAGLYLAAAGPLMLDAVPAVPRHALLRAAPMPRALDGDRLASEQDAFEMRQSVAGGFAISTPRTLAAKIPTWFALCAIVWAALAGTVLPQSSRANRRAALRAS